MDMEQEELCGQLSDTEESLRYLVLIAAGILLSFRATLIQRDALADALCGAEPDLSAVYPLRHTASSLIVGALGFFLCLAVRTWRQRGGSGCGESRSARSGLWAALLVFAAALIRFDDLETAQREQV